MANITTVYGVSDHTLLEGIRDGSTVFHWNDVTGGWGFRLSFALLHPVKFARFICKVKLGGH